jgi:hypothetical protein
MNNVTTNVPVEDGQFVEFVRADPSRDTMELVWGCFFTVVLCTWNIQRLSISSPNQPHWSIRFERFGWAVLTLIAPESIAIFAIDEYLAVRRQTHELQGKLDNWSRKHCFFGKMGGYMLICPNCTKMVVRSREILWLVENHYLEPPFIPEREIDDLASETTFREVVTVLQLGWFALQCIGRAASLMKFALLELTTISFIGCALVTMACWWDKPSGVSTRIQLRSKKNLDNVAIDKMLSETEGSKRQLVQLQRTSPLVESNISLNDTQFVLAAAGCVAIHAAWHVAAWNYAFDTSRERVLWRFCSIAALAIVIMMAVLRFLPKEMSLLQDLYVWVVILPYGLCRLFLMVESIASLRHAPAGIYHDITWSGYLPHF